MFACFVLFPFLRNIICTILTLKVLYTTFLIVILRLLANKNNLIYDMKLILIFFQYMKVGKIPSSIKFLYTSQQTFHITEQNRNKRTKFTFTHMQHAFTPPETKYTLGRTKITSPSLEDGKVE